MVHLDSFEKKYKVKDDIKSVRFMFRNRCKRLVQKEKLSSIESQLRFLSPSPLKCSCSMSVG